MLLCAAGYSRSASRAARNARSAAAASAQHHQADRQAHAYGTQIHHAVTRTRCPSLCTEHTTRSTLKQMQNACVCAHCPVHIRQPPITAKDRRTGVFVFTGYTGKRGKRKVHKYGYVEQTERRNAQDFTGTGPWHSTKKARRRVAIAPFVGYTNGRHIRRRLRSDRLVPNSERQRS